MPATRANDSTMRNSCSQKCHGRGRRSRTSILQNVTNRSTKSNTGSAPTNSGSASAPIGSRKETREKSR